MKGGLGLLVLGGLALLALGGQAGTQPAPGPGPRPTPGGANRHEHPRVQTGGPSRRDWMTSRYRALVDALTAGVGQVPAAARRRVALGVLATLASLVEAGTDEQCWNVAAFAAFPPADAHEFYRLDDGTAARWYDDLAHGVTDAVQEWAQYAAPWHGLVTGTLSPGQFAVALAHVRHNEPTTGDAATRRAAEVDALAREAESLNPGEIEMSAADSTPDDTAVV